jgi:transglutaminase-like putative cysteine protease
MRIRIRHTTTYTYDQPVEYASQLMRLTPSEHAGQRIRSWRVTADGRLLARTDDGYGNTIHLCTVSKAHQNAVIVAEGEVETADTQGVLRDAIERLPPRYWVRATAPTAPDDALRALAHEVERVAEPVPRLHRLMELIRARVDCVAGKTTVTTTAAEALAKGSGVCQDHAHVFIAVAHLLDIPARYVSGYLLRPGGETAPSSHAWAEAHLPKVGWIGFDAANNLCPT